MNRRKGFSMIELLMVIAIIGIIATIAIPLLMSTRRAALDEKARQSVRVVMSAQQAFHTSNGTYGTFDDLALNSAPFLDTRFTDSGADLGNGIEVSLTLGADGQSFEVEADNPGGRHDYRGDETMVVEQI